MAVRRFYKLLTLPALARAGVAIAAATTEEVYTPAAEEMLGCVKPRDTIILSDVYRMLAAGDDGTDTYSKSMAVSSIVKQESIPETHKPPKRASDGYAIPDAHADVESEHDLPPSRVDTRSSLVNV